MPRKKCCHSDTTVCVVEESACESINIAKSRFLRPNTGRRNDNLPSFRHDYRCRSGGAMPRKKMLSFRHDGLCRGICLSVNQHRKKQISAQTPGIEMTTSRHSDTTIGAVVAGLCPVKKCCHSDTTGFVVEESACESINIAKSRFLRPNTGRRNDTSRHSDTTGFVVEESACESINIAKS